MWPGHCHRGNVFPELRLRDVDGRRLYWKSTSVEQFWCKWRLLLVVSCLIWSVPCPILFGNILFLARGLCWTRNEQPWCIFTASRYPAWADGATPGLFALQQWDGPWCTTNVDGKHKGGFLEACVQLHCDTRYELHTLHVPRWRCV